MIGLCLFIVAAAGADLPALPPFQPENARAYLAEMLRSVEPSGTAESDLCFVLARFHSQLGEKDQAERLARRALAANPDRAEIGHFLADILILQDRMEEAVRFLGEALQKQPQHPGGYRRLGMALERLGQRQEARTAYARAIRDAPKDATARFLLGKMLLDDGQLQAAHEQLQLACQLDPREASAVYLLSQAQTRLGDAAAAQKSQQRFRELKEHEKAQYDAKNAGYDDAQHTRTVAARFHTEMAELLLRRSQPAMAEVHLRQAALVQPKDPRPLELLMTILLQAGRTQDARPVCESLVALRPQDATYRANLGTLLLQLKDYPAAVEQLKRALESDPQQLQALHNLARFYLGARRNLPEALEMSRRLVSVRPSAENYDLLGWACYSNGRTNEARTAAAQAVARDPTNTVYRERYQKLQASK